MYIYLAVPPLSIETLQTNENGGNSRKTVAEKHITAPAPI
jgi:hypothetical protein